MWERYCLGVNAMVYIVDAADHDKIEASKNELHNLLEKPQLVGIPILVLGNKRDLEGDAVPSKFCSLWCLHLKVIGYWICHLHNSIHS